MNKIHKPGIYTLIDPCTNDIRYVGKGTPWFSRSRSHLMPSVMKRCYALPVYRWIKKLSKFGLKPLIIHVQEFDCISRPDLSSAEIYWIKHFKALGCSLLNCTDGGEGLLNISNELRQQRSIIARRLKHTDETKERIAASKRSIPKPQHVKDKIAAALIGRKTRPKTTEERERISLSQRHATPIIDNNGNIYRNQEYAARMLNMNSKDINAVLRGRQLTTKGYSFKYFRGDVT